MTNTTTAAALVYYVSSDSESYGDECTVEQAQTISSYISEKMAAYAAKQGYDADIEIRPPFAGQRGRTWDEAGEVALDDMSDYEEANWSDWAGEALN